MEKPLPTLLMLTLLAGSGVVFWKLTGGEYDRRNRDGNNCDNNIRDSFSIGR